MLRRVFWPGLLLSAAAAVAGCDAASAPPAPPKAPPVVVSRAVEEEVTDFEEFQGKTEAFETVEVRAHVSGYLDKLHFEDGADLRKGDPLFTIDPRPFQAELERADANLNQARARAGRLEADRERAIGLYPKGGMSRADYDQIMGDFAEAQAAVKSALAARKTAQLNMDYTKVTAPINGRISRRMIDVGNMVKADETALTYMANLDPMYVYFDVDERTYLKIYRPLVDKEITLAQVKEMSVSMGLTDEKGYPHQGKINFVDNHVDTNTGSVWVRGIFPNPKKLLAPGLFVRVRLPVGDPHRAVLIPERALATDQGQKFVWVVDDEGHATYRRVELGAQHGRKRVVEKGVGAGDRVIVSGLQRVRADPQKGYAEVTVSKEEPIDGDEER
jgi:RND family efflux transporter MFP subunit